jgi:hypothetical protein
MLQIAQMMVDFLGDSQFVVIPTKNWVVKPPSCVFLLWVEIRVSDPNPQLW